MSYNVRRQNIRTEKQRRVQAHLTRVEKLFVAIQTEKNVRPGEGINDLYAKICVLQTDAMDLLSKLENAETLLDRILHPSQHASEVETLKTSLDRLDEQYISLTKQRRAIEEDFKVEGHKDAAPSQTHVRLESTQELSTTPEGYVATKLRHIYNRSYVDLRSENDQMANEMLQPAQNSTVFYNASTSNLLQTPSQSAWKTKLNGLSLLIPLKGSQDGSATTPLDPKIPEGSRDGGSTSAPLNSSNIPEGSGAGAATPATKWAWPDGRIHILSTEQILALDAEPIPERLSPRPQPPRPQTPPPFVPLSPPPWSGRSRSSPRSPRSASSLRSSSIPQSSTSPVSHSPVHGDSAIEDVLQDLCPYTFT